MNPRSRSRGFEWLLPGLMLALFAATLNATEIPVLPLPAGVGVNIHFTSGHTRDLDLIAAAGFKLVRMDFFWSATERAKGQYDWSDYDALTADLDRRGIRAYYILDYSNPLYENGNASPQNPNSVAAFARWAAAAAAHFRGRHVIWEIWNEPNGGFWKPHADVAQYTALALATARAVRQADPKATIVAPACAGFDWHFLESFLGSGVLAYLDGVSVHPYRGGPPETAAADFEKLRALIVRCAWNAQQARIPILSGEWGYSTHTGGVSLQTQAEFIARQQLSNLYQGVPVSIWYDWKNDGPNPADNEHNFGTVTLDLQPKPAYLAIQTLTRELSGYNLSGRHDTGDAKDFVLTLTNPAGKTKLAAWTLGRPRQITFHLKSSWTKKLRLVTGRGEASVIEARHGEFTLSLDGQPEYVTLGKARLR